MDLIKIFLLVFFAFLVGGILIPFLASILGAVSQIVYAIYCMIFKKKQKENKSSYSNYSIKQGKEIK